MTTIFISKMEGLPPTSATKMIDYWLILCQLVPFTQVVLLTAIEYLREDEEDETQKYEEHYEDAKEDENDQVVKKAWAFPSTGKPSGALLVPILLIIGRLLISIEKY